MTEQPTEQWVQTFLRLVTGAPTGGGGPASALRMLPSGRLPSAARLPAVRPERRRNVRRSRPRAVSPASAEESVALRACRSDRLISTDASSLPWIAVDAIEVSHLRGGRP